MALEPICVLSGNFASELLIKASIVMNYETSTYEDERRSINHQAIESINRMNISFTSATKLQKVLSFGICALNVHITSTGGNKTRDNLFSSQSLGMRSSSPTKDQFRKQEARFNRFYNALTMLVFYKLLSCSPLHL